MIGKSITMVVSVIVGASVPASAADLKTPLPAPAPAKAAPVSDAPPSAPVTPPASSVEMTPAAAATTAPTLKPEVKEVKPEKKVKVKTARSHNEKKDRAGILASIANSAAEAPAAVYRQSARELDAGVNDLTNESSNPILRVPATLVSLPFCIFAGCVEGAVYAFRYRHSDDCPDNMKK